jgi:RNA polymerase sigma-70 factor, ECF subfamily
MKSLEPAIGPTDPARLVQRILAGERSAEEELVRRYSCGVAVMVRRIVREPSATDDLYQETFRIVLEKVRQGDLRESERLSGFVCGVARNLAIEYLRRPRQMTSLEEVEDTALVADQVPDQLSTLLEEEKVKAVRQVLQELATVRDREILRRFYLLEEDKNRICASLGLSNLHFNRVLYRARERFRELYEQSREKQRA